MASTGKKASELTPKERLVIVEMAAARYSLTEIAEKTGARFSAVVSIVNSVKEDIERKRKELDAARIETGLRSRERRIDELESLFRKIMADQLEQDTFATEIRVTSKGLKIEVPVFNAPAVREIRGILDDIAKETNGRAAQLQLTGKEDGPIRIEPIDYMAAVAPILSEKETPKHRGAGEDVELTEEELDEIIGGD